MASIDLYSMDISAPCRIVELVAKLADIKVNRKEINLFAGEHLRDDYLKINPWHKVPFLVDCEVKINESRAISQYLINKYMPADNKLYPQDPVKRAKIDELLNFDLGTLFASAGQLLYYKIKNPSEGMNPENEKVYRANLKLVDDMLAGKKYLIDDHFTLADIAIATGMSFPEACDYNISEFKNITKWIDTCKQEIPHFKEINEEPTKKFRDFIKAKHPPIQKPGSEFLQKRLQRGQKYFDSGDYNMAIASTNSSSRKLPDGTSPVTAIDSKILNKRH